jgi:hypothetical protein
VDARGESEYQWANLACKDKAVSSSVRILSLGDRSDVVQRTVKIRGHWQILELLASAGNCQSGSLNRQIELLDLSKAQVLQSDQISNRQRIVGLATHVKRLVGCFQDRIVFPDHQFWLCTWDLEVVYTKHKRHFFLPKD